MSNIAPTRRFSLRLVVFASVSFLFTSSSFAIEPATEFLEGLKERAYYDMAIEYLDMAKDSPLISPAFKETIPYEKGLTLILASRTSRDMKIREKQLDEAQEMLKEFVDNRKTHPFAALANSQLANLLVERGSISVERSKGKNVTDEQKTALILDARKNFDEAISVFQSTLDDLKKRLERFGTLDKNNPSHVRLIEIRDRYRADFLQARLLIPAIREQKADTYPDDAAERKALLTEAAKEFKDAHEDYRTRIAGLYAQLYEGRCYSKLKNEKEALYCFNSLLDQPDAPEFRGLKLKTLVLAVPVWMESDPPKVDEAIAKINPILSTANRDESLEPDWLFLRLSYARANKLKADALSQKTPRTKDETADMTRAQREAVSAARIVARIPSDYRRDAQDLLSEMIDYEAPEEGDEQPRTFVEARTKGKEALDDMNTAVANYSKLYQEHAQATDATQKAELAESIKGIQKEIQTKATQSYDLLRLALSMADADTPTEDINVVRYLLCYLYFYLEDYYDAAAMGEFVAMRYPQSSGARQCAKITMACYIKARKEALDAAKEGGWTANVKFESDKITDICRFITKQWSDQPEAVEAAHTLIIFSLQDNDFKKAAEYLDVIPENLQQRGESERLIGQQIWTTYLITINSLQRQGAAQDIVQAKKKELAADVSDAALLLEKGLERVGGQSVTQPIAAAALALAQIYVERGETDRAIALLEDSKIGPLSLVKQKHPAAIEREGYDIEAYKTSLRAYIAGLSDKDAAKRDSAKKKAKDVIGQLKAAMGTTPEDKEKLVRTFVVMANNLKEQMDSLTAINEKKAFAEGLSSFLTELSGESNEMNIRTWVADTFSKLGETFAANPEIAKPYYDQSIAAFTDILKDPSLTEGTRLQIEMLLGDTKLLLNDYEGALEEYVKVLRKKNTMLNVQVQAAMAFQQWGDALIMTPSEAKEKYKKAMVGDFLDDRPTIDGVKNKNFDRNVVWGWGRLFQITMRYPQFRNTFFKARYNLALSRFRYAEMQGSDEDRTKYRKMAKNDILSTMKVAKDLGGPEWQPKFNGLMKLIQRSLKEKDTGLPPTS